MQNLKKALIVITLLLMLPCSAGYAAGEAGKPPEEAVQAKEDEPVPVQKEEWQFFVAPYLWIPGASINTTFSGHTSSISEGWYDIVPHLFSNALGAMGRFEAWKGRWGIYVDSYYLYIGDSVSDSAGKTIFLGPRGRIPASLLLNGDLKFISRAASVDFGPRYLVGTMPLSGDKPLPLLSFEVLGGGRYNFYNQYLKLGLSATLSGPLGNLSITRGGSFVNKIERSFLEPFLGMRLGLYLNPKVVALLRFTVGGFGFAEDNNFDMDMELDVGYKVHKNIYAYAGWRARYVSFSTDGLSLNVWFNGPVLGAVFAF
ncbi:MAG: hypothetical protein M1438_17905 [Deltaproteobacteria bacterium]|nr:hypothetical protein [Deltaproteobacteria bacterium]